MPLYLPGVQTFRTLTADGWLLFGTRGARLFAYGLFSVVLVMYLIAVGLSEGQIGLLLTLTLLGDTAISLWLTTKADRLGRRKMLVVGSLLMVFAGVIFAVTRDFWLLLLAAALGVISPRHRRRLARLHGKGRDFERAMTAFQGIARAVCTAPQCESLNLQYLATGMAIVSGQLG